MESFADFYHEFEADVVVANPGPEITSGEVDHLFFSKNQRSNAAILDEPHYVPSVDSIVSSHAVSPEVSPSQDFTLRQLHSHGDEKIFLDAKDDYAFCVSDTDTEQERQQQDSSSTDSESDIEVFLEYARDIVAYNNLAYDPKSFHKFEQAVGLCIAHHFFDNDDQDSLVSQADKSQSSCINEDGKLRCKRDLLRKPSISKIVSKRIQGASANLKSETRLDNASGEAQLAVSPAKNHHHSSASDADSDDSFALVAAAISQECLKDFRRSQFNTHTRASKHGDGSDSSENEVQKRPNRPKNRRYMRRSRKEKKRELPPHRRSGSQPTPSSDVRRAVQSFSEGLSHSSPCSSGTSFSTLLSSSPVEKDRARHYLKEHVPRLYESVVERFQKEAQLHATDFEGGNQNESCPFRKTEKVSLVPQSYNSSELTEIKNLEALDCDDGFSPGRPNFPFKPCIDTTRVIRPSNIKAGVTFSIEGASSRARKEFNESELVIVSLTEDIERVLQGMIDKQTMLRLNLDTPQLNEGQGDLNEDRMTVRVMALIHKFRAKRKAAAQAKILEQTRKLNHQDMTHSSFSESPTESNDFKTQSVRRSPTRLDSYMTQGLSSLSSKSSPSSSIDEQKQKIRQIKEKSGRTLPSIRNRQESREIHLQSDSPLVDDSADRVSMERKTTFLEGLPMSKVSPFGHVKFTRKDVNLQALSDKSSRLSVVNIEPGGRCDSDSLLMKEMSSNTSSTSSGNNPKNNSFLAVALRSDDINRIIIDPQSPENLSPIRGCRACDLLDRYAMTSNTNSPRKARSTSVCDYLVPSTRFRSDFEDISSTGRERLHLSTSISSAWSEMSFQSDLVKFPQMTFRKGHLPGGFASASKGLSIEAISERIEEVVDFSGYNDSFDAIVSRKTPSLCEVPSNSTDESPAGVMDTYFQCQIRRNKASDILSFVDEEDETDILFTDNESSFLETSFIDMGSPLQSPIFLSTNRFEI